MFQRERELNNTHKKAFTVIELLVVIAVIGLLSSIVLVGLKEAKEKARYRKAQAELSQISTAIELLYQDTGFHPNKLSISPCVQNPEIYLNSCAAGLLCNDGSFPNWNGPYINSDPKDPWDTYYFFDPDFCCGSNVKGCERVPDGTWVRAIVSFGPNKVENYGPNCPYFGSPTSDDIVLILCH